MPENTAVHKFTPAFKEGPNRYHRYRASLSWLTFQTLPTGHSSAAVNLHFQLTVYLIAGTWLVQKLISERFVQWHSLTAVKSAGKKKKPQLTHLCFFTEIPTPYESSLSRVDKCYLCHTLASCLAGMSPACWQSRPQWERCLCLRGGARLGETKGAHSSEPPASRPSIPLSRRERRPRNVSQACREMATCSQSLGTLLPDVTHSSFCSCPTVGFYHSGLKSPQTGQRHIFF